MRLQLEMHTPQVKGQRLAIGRLKVAEMTGVDHVLVLSPPVAHQTLKVAEPLVALIAEKVPPLLVLYSLVICERATGQLHLAAHLAYIFHPLPRGRQGFPRGSAAWVLIFATVPA